MRFCSVVLSCLALAGLIGCSAGSEDHGFHVNSVQLNAAPRRLDVRMDQELVLSPSASEALENGVPLVLVFDMELRDSNTLTLLADQQLKYEVEYLPMSEHYQLSIGNGKRTWTYPRLRHVLGRLSTVRTPFSTGPLAPGDYEFRVRVRLDRSRLPAPMQLPAAFTSQWRHDSNWSQWPLKINA